MITASVMVATGVNTGGDREVLGVQIATSESQAGWQSCLAGGEGNAAFGL